MIKKISPSQDNKYNLNVHATLKRVYWGKLHDSLKFNLKKLIKKLL